MYGRPITKSCGQLMFNDNDKVCDWPANVMRDRPMCDPDNKQIATTETSLVTKQKEQIKSFSSGVSKPKTERGGQREISLPPKGQNNIESNPKTDKKMPFAPGIQQPEMFSQTIENFENKKDTSREQKEIHSPEINQATNSIIDSKAKGSRTKWTVARVRPVKPVKPGKPGKPVQPATTAKPRKQLRSLGMGKDVTKLTSGKSTNNKIRSSRKLFIRNNQEALRRRRQFLRSKVNGNGVIDQNNTVKEETMIEKATQTETEKSSNIESKLEKITEFSQSLETEVHNSGETNNQEKQPRRLEDSGFKRTSQEGARLATIRREMLKKIRSSLGGGEA
eukprot:GFUD01047197.1.p1 GENE.GFUD01047197.1~~GFUD01047197.1.p1  ORF type:complete len:386 (-),score=126.70 GFUD01047197.1:1-1005(-)